MMTPLERVDKSLDLNRETTVDNGGLRCHSDEFKQNEPINDRKEIVKWEFEMMFYDVILAIWGSLVQALY